MKTEKPYWVLFGSCDLQFGVFFWILFFGSCDLVLVIFYFHNSFCSSAGFTSSADCGIGYKYFLSIKSSHTLGIF